MLPDDNDADLIDVCAAMRVLHVNWPDLHWQIMSGAIAPVNETATFYRRADVERLRVALEAKQRKAADRIQSEMKAINRKVFK